MPKFRENPIKKKNVCTDGPVDWKTLFHRNLPATTRGPIKKLRKQRTEIRSRALVVAGSYG